MRSPVSDCQPSLQSANIQVVDVSHKEPAADTGGDSEPQPSIGLGPTLRRAWVAYQRRLDRAMTEAGFDERRFPDGRVLRLSAGPTGSTISNIGRELGITRQGAGKVVSHLHDRGYVSVADSPTSGSEKAVSLTVSGDPVPRGPPRRGPDHRASVCERNWERSRSDALHRLLDVLDSGEEVRMRTYIPTGRLASVRTRVQETGPESVADETSGPIWRRRCRRHCTHPFGPWTSFALLCAYAAAFLVAGGILLISP